MPHTARLTRNRSRRVAHGSIPRGYSTANGELTNQAITSLLGFYGTSEVLSVSEPQFPLDTAGIVERIVKEALKETLARLKNLLTLHAGWNGYDALAPNPDAVLHAENWIGRLFLEVADSGRSWIRPNVIADANGDVVFEWWCGKKKLTVYIGDESAEYVKVWGTDIHSEMSEGDAEAISTCRALWLWLMS